MIKNYRNQNFKFISITSCYGASLQTEYPRSCWLLLAILAPSLLPASRALSYLLCTQRALWDQLDALQDSLAPPGVPAI